MSESLNAENQKISNYLFNYNKAKQSENMLEMMAVLISAFGELGRDQANWDFLSSLLKDFTDFKDETGGLGFFDMPANLKYIELLSVILVPYLLSTYRGFFDNKKSK